MHFKVTVIPHKLHFRFDARTSRGAIANHQVYYLKMWSSHDPSICGWGECAPLAGLSIDHRPELKEKIEETCRKINKGETTISFDEPLPEELDLKEWPALQFALETALLDLRCGGRKLLYKNNFTKGTEGIAINGLVWMGDKNFMQEQIKSKLQEGFSCLKLKIGSLDFETELELLQQIRETAGSEDLTIRVDANGAFAVDDAYRKLEKLSKYAIHSIEQPIRQGQAEQMAQLCAYSPVPVALDEELIGVVDTEARQQLLEQIKPQYIILKPTLLGGLRASEEWINLAEKQGIGWWMTSALESNIGLNAISQFTGNYSNELPQGLGTGQLYHNNIDSPLSIVKGKLWYQRKKDWESPETVASA